MIKYENPNGYIEITNNYFARLVGNAAQSCFGVTRMVNANPVQTMNIQSPQKLTSQYIPEMAKKYGVLDKIEKDGTYQILEAAEEE